MKSSFKERNTKIVEEIENGRRASELSRKVGLSRERVRQIYNSLSPIPYSHWEQQRLSEKIVVKKKKVKVSGQKNKRCEKCCMVISGEFEDKRSKHDKNLCYGCDGSSLSLEDKSLVNSGVIQGN